MATWTPPLSPDYLKYPLPLPPECTCAFTTTSTKGFDFDVVCIIRFAMFSASSGVLALKLYITNNVQEWDWVYTSSANHMLGINVDRDNTWDLIIKV